MRITHAIAGFLVVSSSAGAATITLTDANIVSSGWKKTATSVYGGTTDASVTSATIGATNAFTFDVGPMPIAWEFQWAGISTAGLDGVKLADITSLRIREYGVAGDGANWQPPSFSFIVDRGDTNQRCLKWLPWSDGTPRAAGTWQEYDAAVDGRWVIQETLSYYSTFAGLQAALPNAYLEYSAQLPLSYGYASQHSFNVGICPLYDEDRALFNGVSGHVDWFEVGIQQNVTRYDLVPEPTALWAITGVCLLALRRKRQRVNRA